MSIFESYFVEFTKEQYIFTKPLHSIKTGLTLKPYS
jgi:hypothetical protein